LATHMSAILCVKLNSSTMTRPRVAVLLKPPLSVYTGSTKSKVADNLGNRFSTMYEKRWHNVLADFNQQMCK